MRCKACDAEMSEIRNRNVMDETGRLHVLMEELCPRCIVESRVMRYNEADVRVNTERDLYEAFKTIRS